MYQKPVRTIVTLVCSAREDPRFHRVALSLGLVFSLAAPPPAFASAQAPAQVMDSLSVALTESDLWRVKEVYHFWKERGKEIWPGVSIEETPIVFVFPEQNAIAVGHPAPQKEWKALPQQIPILDREGHQFPDRSFMYGAMTSKIGGVPTISINTLETFEGYVKSTLGTSNPALAAYEKPLSSYLGEILHELFHAHQYREQRLLPPKKEKPILRTKIDYPYLDSEACLLLGLEGRVLADLMREKQPERIKQLWIDFATVRSERRRRLDPDLVRLERYMELTEGTAQYVGWALQHASDSTLSPLREVAADPRSKGLYASPGSLDAAISQLLDRLSNPSQSQYMNYVYTTGMALARCLDTLQPGWKEGFFRKHTSLDELFGVDYRPAPDAAARLKDLRLRYGADRMMTEISNSISQLAAKQAKKIQAFQAREGKRYRLVFPGTPARGILVYAPVQLAETLRERLYEAGATKIESTDAHGDATSAVEFARALPLHFDRVTGQIELIVPPETPSDTKISAKHVRKSGKSTVYSGEVGFENGLWSWKGDRLEVSESNDGVTLRFYP